MDDEAAISLFVKDGGTEADWPLVDEAVRLFYRLQRRADSVMNFPVPQGITSRVRNAARSEMVDASAPGTQAAAWKADTLRKLNRDGPKSSRRGDTRSGDRSAL